jgi:hypothetical protein
MTQPAHDQLTDALEALASEEPYEIDTTEGADRFVVDDDEKAAWAMRKLAESEDEVRRIRRLAEPELVRLQKMLAGVEAWVEKQTTAVQRDHAFFTSLLERWAVEQRKAGRKSVSLPYGKVTTRAIAVSVNVSDSKAFVDWAATEGRLELLNMTPAKAAIKIAMLTDGESLPGVDIITPDEDDASVTIKPVNCS